MRAEPTNFGAVRTQFNKINEYIKRFKQYSLIIVYFYGAHKRNIEEKNIFKKKKVFLKIKVFFYGY